jgi:serine/threonine protein kinase
MSEGMIGRAFGAYTVTGFLGRGGMATVFKGYHAALDRNVAIKVMAADMLEDENFLKRFGNEARLLAKLQHPHILPIYDFGETDGVPYIVMPLMNDSLKDKLKPGEPLTLDEALPILNAIGQALDFAHTQGVLHRDVKPNNVLFDQHDNPFLADFGIARAMQASRGLTGTGILGTLEYMSPEQARGDALDGRSDVYSFGIMAHQMLTGHLAFSSTTPAGMLFKHISEPPRPPREFNPALPATVDQILLKVLAKDPNQRYQTASDFTKALRDAHAGVVSHTPTQQVVAALTREVDNPPPQPAYKPPPVAQRFPTGNTPPPITAPPPAISQPASPNAYMPWLIGCGVIALLGCLGLGGTALMAPALLGLVEPTATQRPTERPSATPTPRRPTATPRPTFTPRATESGSNNSSTSSEAGVFELFRDNANGWAIEPQEGDASVETFSIEDGVFHWEIEAKRDLVSFNSPDSDANYWENGEVMADFEVTSGPDDATIGLLIRYVDADNYYIFNVSPGTQKYSFYARKDDEWQTLVDYTEAGAINRTGVNRLRARIEGTQITLEINGEVVNSLSDSNITEAGYGGVAVTLFNAGDKATFEITRYEAYPLEAVLLADDFEDVGNPNDWATTPLDDQYGLVEPVIANGKYDVDVEAKQGFIYYSSPDMDDVEEGYVAVSAKRLSGAENVDYGLVFQRGDDGYYYFGIADVGQYTLLRYDGEWTTLIDWTDTNTIQSGEVNRLSIRRVGDTLVMHINGEWVNTYEDTDSPVSAGVGGVGFQLYDPGETARFEFDDFEVRAP